MEDIERRLDLLLEIQGRELQERVVDRLLKELTPEQKARLVTQIIERSGEQITRAVEISLRGEVRDPVLRLVGEKVQEYLRSPAVLQRIEAEVKKVLTVELVQKVVEDNVPFGLREVVRQHVQGLLKK